MKIAIIGSGISGLSTAFYLSKFSDITIFEKNKNFGGHANTYDFNFKNKNTPCIRSFYQEYEISDNILNCEYEGILGTVAGIIGIMQANEILKKILSIGKNLNGQVLVLDLLNLNFRKIKFKKLKDVKKKI